MGQWIGPNDENRDETGSYDSPNGPNDRIIETDGPVPDSNDS